LSVPLMLAIAALACAVFLLVQMKHRLWAAIAVAVAGLELLIAFGLVRLSIANFPLPTVLAIALVVAGVLLWLKVQGKTHVSAATVVAAVGAFQTLTLLH
jgi:hypothetical protein